MMPRCGSTREPAKILENLDQWRVHASERTIDSLMVRTFSMFGACVIWTGFVFGTLLLTGCSSIPAAKQPFAGLWVAPESESVSFELDLKQTGTLIEGYHAVLVVPSGRIEVALPTDGGSPSVNGELISKDTARVSYALRKNAGSGEGTLTLVGRKLVWKLIRSSGESCFPATCPLVLQQPSSH